MLGKVFLFVFGGLFSLPLLPGEGQHSTAFCRELHRLVQALVQVPLCLQTCWSSALFMLPNDLCVVHVLDEVLLSERNTPGSSVCCCVCPVGSQE